MTKLFAKTGSAMRCPTYILIQLSSATQHYGLFAGAVIGIFVAGFATYTRQPAGRRWWDETKLKIPLLGISPERFVLRAIFARPWPTCCKMDCRCSPLSS